MKPLPGLEPAATIRRFEAQGTPNRLGAAGLAAALRHRNAQGRLDVDRHILELSGELIDGLVARGATVWTPREERSRAGIVSFTFGGSPAADKALRDYLERRAIFASTRYCSGIGGVRLATHLFNTPGDVRAFFAALDAFQRR
jgi:selenocysteine lyase/cysteine desulfurase